MTFKEKFLFGKCDFEEINDYIDTWHTDKNNKLTLGEFLGLNDNEYQLMGLPDERFKAELTRLSKALVGIVHYSEVETEYFFNKEDYINTIKEHRGDHFTTGFNFKTFVKDESVKNEIDHIINDEYGDDDHLEEYRNSLNPFRTQLYRKATDELELLKKELLSMEPKAILDKSLQYTIYVYKIQYCASS